MSKQTKIEEKFNPELIEILGINIFKTNIETTDDFIENNKKSSGFEFGVAQSMGYNLEDKRIQVRMFYNFEGKDEQHEPVGLSGEYGIDFQFFIQNLDDFVLKNAINEVEIHTVLASSLIRIAYSTSRGIILEKTQGTVLNGAILPVINVFNTLNQ